jgi:aldose 1-epimerase
VQAVRLSSSDGLEATLAPADGMLRSLAYRGRELLVAPGELPAYAHTGVSFGMPLLHPWANRLSRERFELGGRPVRLDGDAVRREDGLPIHGLLQACPLWELGGGGSRAVARLGFSTPALLEAFPFPHTITVAVSVRATTLAVDTLVEAPEPVPIAFGWHPFLTLRDVPRADWEVRLGVRERAVVDERGLPTGETEPAGWTGGRLGDRALDDHYTRLAAPPEFALAGGGTRLVVRLEAGYENAQVFAPADHAVVSFEPMTAPLDALVSGPRWQSRHGARFSVTVTADDGHRGEDRGGGA